MGYDNHFLFSETYLNETLKKMNKNEITEADEQFENILSWYREYKDAWELYEDILIDTLGFSKELDGQYRILCSDSTKPVAIAYFLKNESDLGSTVKGKYYAVDAVQYAKKHKVNWAIVTNGICWRLYYAENVSPYEFYFEVNTGNALETGKADSHSRALYRMFSAQYYAHNENNICLMDAFKEESDSENEKIEDILRSKSESILKGLCYGLKDNMNLSSFDDDTRNQIYGDAIVLLYRLLFLGYAEARNLLPVVAGDPDYQDSFSALCETARDYYMSGQLNTVGDDYDLGNRLDSQLRTYVDKKYNGGLFSNDDKPILSEYRIANKQLAICLMELSFIAGRRKDYTEKIEYKDLSVRNLGAIYEGLLEYQLFIADELMVQRKSKDKISYIKASEVRLTNSDRNNLVKPGEIYLSQDAKERKETGAYYTPEDVVEYIVSQTVDKKLDELKKDLDQELFELRDELSYEPVERNRIMLQHEIDEKTVEFINEKILTLGIIDSAMGSGHFLVNAAYHVSNFIVDLLEDNRWENSEVNADVTYWKRKVVENCIYGIDINYLSVLLARLSLWLISASNDKALSFLDHHLRCGNSIIGTTLDRVQYQNKDYPILNITKENYVYPVLRKYEKIREIGSNTKEDVLRQHKLYDEITEDMKIVRRKLDYYLASMYAGGISDKRELYDVLATTDIHFFDKERFYDLFKYADENQFFHWEIEFPEIYMRGGFDIAIGNPPYVECSSNPYKGVMLRSLNSRNLYSYMLERTIQNVKNNGVYGFIVPLAAFYSSKMESLQKLLKETGNLYISNYGVRPAKIFKRAEQRVSIIIGDVSDSRHIFSTDYQRWFTNERSQLFKNLKYADVSEVDHFKYVPKISENIEKGILKKLLKIDGTLGDYCVSNGDNEIVYHSVGRYWLKAFDFVPVFKNERSGVIRSSKYKSLYFREDVNRDVILALINSSLFYWYWIVMSAARDFTKKDITDFPFNIALIQKTDQNRIGNLVAELMDSYKRHSVMLETNGASGKTILQEFHPSFNKEIMDKLEPEVGKLFDFNDDEVKFLINYDLKFRLGDDD